MITPTTNPLFQAFNHNGKPLSGGKLYTYSVGTTSDKATYSDYNLQTANANPVILNSRGEATVYLAGPTKFVLTDSYDYTIWTFDNIGTGNIITLADEGTPTVLGGESFVTGGTTTITDFDDGFYGQIITVISAHAVTITDGTNILLKNSTNFVMAASDTLTLILKSDDKWYEVSRSINTSSVSSDFTETITTDAQTLSASGVTLLDTTVGAIAGTLGSGTKSGQLKTVIMTVDNGDYTLSVTNHETSDPETFAFTDVDDTAVFMWTNSEWITIKLSGASAT